MTSLALVCWLLLAYTIARLIIGSSLSIDVLRDAAPYGYVVVALLAGSRVGGADARSTLDRTGRALTCVLKFHAVWVLAATTSQVFANWHFPVNPAAVHIWLFQTRNDMDTMLLGVLASILVFRVLSGRRSGYPLLWLAVCLIGTLSTGSRAGLASAILLCCLSVVLAYRRGLTRNAGLISAALVPMFLIGMMAVLPQTDIGQRLAGTLGASADGSELGLGAAGTTEARKEAWVALYNYSVDDAFRAVAGVGFGPDVLFDSGARRLLVGADPSEETIPRAPHNFWLNTLARLGVIGLMLYFWLIFLALREAIRAWPRGNELDLLVGSLILGTLIIATLGVVMESPFGAVPFYYCVGLLMAQQRAQRHTRRKYPHLESAIA